MLNRIWSATRTPLHKLLPFSVLVTSQEHGVLVDASYGIAISLVSSRPPCVRPKCIRIWSATRTPLHKLLPFFDQLTGQEHGVLVAFIHDTWIALYRAPELYTTSLAKAIKTGQYRDVSRLWPKRRRSRSQKSTGRNRLGCGRQIHGRDGRLVASICFDAVS